MHPVVARPAACILIFAAGCPLVPLATGPTQFACASDEDCTRGHVCERTSSDEPGVCGSFVGRSDASQPVLDAAHADASGVDAGLDAGRLRDAALIDGSTPDAAHPDAGTRDGAVLDASTADAAVMDAGGRDAGARDAAALDAMVFDGAVEDASSADASKSDAALGDAAAPYLEGVIFEDVDYAAGLPVSQEVVDSPIAGVAVELYRPDASFLARTVSSDAGTWRLPLPGAGAYLVRVIGNDVRRGNESLAEQVFESDGVNSRSGPGALCGNDPFVDDRVLPPGAGPGDISLEVQAGAGATTGIAFGFSYHVICQTLDEGSGSLRQFILNANEQTGPDIGVVDLVVDAGAPARVALTSGLPALVDDGTQLHVTTGGGGTRLWIDGQSVDGGACLELAGADISIAGMVLSGCVTGAWLSGSRNAVRDLVVESNVTGIVVSGQDAQVRNSVVQLNDSHGIQVTAGTGHRIINGRVLDNGGSGIVVVGSARVDIAGVDVSDNVDLGIDLGGDGVTPNDLGDADPGPNGLLNHPVIHDVHLVDGGLRVSGEAPAGARVDLFSGGADPSGYGEGARFLGAFTEGGSSDGDSSPGVADTSAQRFTVVDVSQRSPAETVSATATVGDVTSEFSRSRTLLPWWDSAWSWREQLSITAGASAIPDDYTLTLHLDHAALVAAGRSRSDGMDLRIACFDGSVWLERPLTRVFPESLNPWDTPSTALHFMAPTAVAAGSTLDNCYLYYGNPVVTTAPGDLGGIFRIGGAFSGPGYDPGFVPSLANGATASIVGDALRLDADSSDDKAAVVALNMPVRPSDGFEFQQRVRVSKVAYVSGFTGPEAKIIGLVQAPQIPGVAVNTVENPRRRVVAYVRGDTQRLYIFYADGATSTRGWNGTTWGTSANCCAISLGVDYFVKMVSDGVSFTISVIRASDASVVTQTAPVPWSSVHDDGDSLWMYWGEVYTNAYHGVMATDWAYMRPLVVPEPTVGRGPALPY